MPVTPPARSASLAERWFANPRADLLAGLVVALALIPEAIGFSIIAGVAPAVGLYASFSIAVVIAFTGGRPGMISAATAAVAVLVVPLVRDHGVEYLFAATVLMGVVQLLAGALKLHLAMQFVSRSVITGFVNALAILIFSAQLPQLTGVGWESYAMVLGGLAIIYGVPRLTRAVPSPLIAIAALTVLAVATGVGVNRVGDMGDLPHTLPRFALPRVPLTWETLRIIAPYSVTMAAVGLLETLLTAQIVDDLTDTPSDKRREMGGQGIANLVTGVLGGMGGCAMIGQSVINVKSGGSGRLSTLTAGVVLLALLVAGGPIVAAIPMPALVAVMIMVSIGTFSWTSVRDLGRMPWQSTAVMLATVATTAASHDLARGVGVGVLLSGLFFAGKVRGLFRVDHSGEQPGRDCYTVSGEVFFASADRFIGSFDVAGGARQATIDVSAAHFWDISAVAALDKVVLRFRRHGTEVTVVGLNRQSSAMIGRFAVAPGVVDHPPGAVAR